MKLVEMFQAENVRLDAITDPFDADEVLGYNMYHHLHDNVPEYFHKIAMAYLKIFGVPEPLSLTIFISGLDILLRLIETYGMPDDLGDLPKYEMEELRKVFEAEEERNFPAGNVIAGPEVV